MELISAHASDIVSIACTVLGAFGGLWAVFHRLRLLLQQEIRDYAASRIDVARIEGKIDIVLSALIVKRIPRKASK